MVGRGTLEAFDPRALAAYRQSCNEPTRIHAFCEDYRAGATRRRRAGRGGSRPASIACPTLVVWSEFYLAAAPAGRRRSTSGGEPSRRRSTGTRWRRAISSPRNRGSRRPLRAVPLRASQPRPHSRGHRPSAPALRWEERSESQRWGPRRRWPLASGERCPGGFPRRTMPLAAEEPDYPYKDNWSRTCSAADASAARRRNPSEAPTPRSRGCRRRSPGPWWQVGCRRSARRSRPRRPSDRGRRNKAAAAREGDRRRAHGAGLEGHVEVAARQALLAERLAGGRMARSLGMDRPAPGALPAAAIAARRRSPRPALRPRGRRRALAEGEAHRIKPGEAGRPSRSLPCRSLLSGPLDRQHRR